MPTRAPRTACSSRSSAAASSCSPSLIEPEISALGERVRPRTVCAVTLLPEPDSPTIASTSPGWSSKETPSTARTRPLWVANETRRSSTVSSAPLMRPPSGALYARRECKRTTGSSSGLRSEADAGVAAALNKKDQGVEEDDEEGAEHDDRHHRRQVEVFQRFVGVLDDAVEAEDAFDQDRAADQGAEVEAEDGDDRDQRVAHHVAAHHPALAEALGPRGAHVVLVHHVEHARAQHPAVEADVEDRQRGPGQDQVFHPFERAFGEFDVAPGGEDFGLVGEVAEEDRAEQEDRHRDPGHGDDRQHPVEQAAGAHRREVAEEDAEEHPDHGGADAEREGRRDPFDDPFDDVFPPFVGDHVAGEDLLHHRQVLLRERVVEAPFFGDALDQPRVRVLAGHAHRRVGAGHDVEDQEGEDGDREEDGDHPAQAPDHEASHQTAVPLGSAMPVWASSRSFERGSSASRRPSPKTLTESTVSRTITPGMTLSWGALEIRSKPLPTIVPQEVAGGCTPTPRKESVDSSSMLLAMPRVKKMMIVEARLGSSSLNITRIAPAPCASAASTNSFSRRERTSPRRGRAM